MWTALILTAALAQGGSATLFVEAEGFQNDRGQACVALFATADGFPVGTRKALRLAVARIEGGRARVALEGLPPGEYAVALFHDENSNFEIDKNFLGIPREGLGASNDAKGRFGPPSFRDAALQLSPGARTARVKLVYL